MSQLPVFKYDHTFTAPVRLLARESHAIFTSIPRNGVDMNCANAIAISRRYRSIVLECIENLSTDIASDHSEQIKNFKDLEVIWNLCEILLLDVHQTGTLIIQLKNWIKMHFDTLSVEHKAILRLLDANNYKLNENDVPDTYWELLTRLVIRGEIKRATLLLKSHFEFESNNQLQIVAEMLENMPLSNQYIVHEFCNKWTNWSNWCRRERETGQFDGNPSLMNIVRLLSQDQEVFKQLAQYCETWYQLVVANLLYTDPCIRETDLPELCRRSIATFKENHPAHIGESSEPNDFDEIIISAFEYDLLQVIARCCSHLDDNWWFVAHFVDLLHCGNQLKIHEIVESDKLREKFLLDYASTLFDDENLWPIGVSYLDNCPSQGHHYLEALLARVSLDIDDDKKAHKLASIAKKRNLVGISKSVYLMMARNWLSKTLRLGEENLKDDRHKRAPDHSPSPINLSNALYWAIKSGDTSLITFLSDQYLYYYVKTGNFPDCSVFESLRRSPLNNERLAFLAKYYEFKQILANPEDGNGEALIEAGNLMRALLASKIYPRFFCKQLLDDTRKLLGAKPQLVFPTEKTLDLARSVEEVFRDGNIAGGDRALRKKLVLNMARALIAPVGSEN